MSVRHFGLTDRGASGALTTPRSSRGIHNAPLPLPYRSSRAPLERGKALQALIDCLAVASAILLVCVTGVAVSASVFILFFVGY